MPGFTRPELEWRAKQNAEVGMKARIRAEVARQIETQSQKAKETNTMDDTAPTTAPADPVDDGFEWAIVEIFGHRRHVGRAREEERFGSKMLRIDTPLIGPGEGEITWSSHFYGGSSIFSYTPTDETTVMRHAQRRLNTPALPYRDHAPDDDNEYDDRDDPHDGGIEEDD